MFAIHPKPEHIRSDYRVPSTFNGNLFVKEGYVYEYCSKYRVMEVVSGFLTQDIACGWKGTWAHKKTWPRDATRTLPGLEKFNGRE